MRVVRSSDPPVRVVRSSDPPVRVVRSSDPLCMLVPNILFFSGAKQNGTVLGDVVLPLWAKGDPKEFIRVQREVGGVC